MVNQSLTKVIFRLAPAPSIHHLPAYSTWTSESIIIVAARAFPLPMWHRKHKSVTRRKCWRDRTVDRAAGASPKLGAREWSNRINRLNASHFRGRKVFIRRRCISSSYTGSQISGGGRSSWWWFFTNARKRANSLGLH